MDKLSRKFERFMGITLNINPGFNLISVLAISILRFKRLKNAKWNKINIYFWIGLFISGIISLVGAYDKPTAFSSFLIPFIFIWLYIIGKYMIDNPIMFIKDMVKGTAFLALLTVLAEYFSWEVVYNGFDIIKGTGRASIMGIGDNGLGILLQAGIIASLGLMVVENDKKEKVFNLIYIILFISALIISSSRGAMVGTAAGSIILAIFVSWKIIAVITSIVLFALFINKDFYERVLSIFSLKNKSNYMRIKVYEGTLDLIKDHFFFGVGPGNFLSAYPKYQVPGEKINALSPHNNYFNIITGWGVVGGLFFFGWIVYIIIRNTIGVQNNYKKIIIAILIGFWVHVVFNDLATVYSAVLMGLLDNKNLN